MNKPADQSKTWTKPTLQRLGRIGDVAADLPSGHNQAGANTCGTSGKAQCKS